jgi:hypothetical protein
VENEELTDMEREIHRRGKLHRTLVLNSLCGENRDAVELFVELAKPLISLKAN